MHYNPETGSITWKNKGKRLDGKEIGFKNEKGYIRVECEGTRLRAHRIAWYLYYGEEPPEQIDHINGCTSDNRICNLRLANQAQNCWNTSLSKANSSGVKGISFCKRKKKWLGRVGANRKVYRLGYYRKYEDAVLAVINARKKLHGEFANLAANIDINELAP